MEKAQLHATWEEILKKLENSLSKMVCDTWLKPITPITLTTTTLELGTPTDFSKDWIEKHYMQLIIDASYEVTKAKLSISITSFHLQDDTAEENDTQIPLIYSAPVSAPTQNISSPSISNIKPNAPLPITPGDSSSLNPKYTFETFVTGNSNRFAHAAALAVAESPSKVYNPFFMYGGVGLGKTHLMHAIGHKILQNNPNMRVLYISSEKFTNELINSIRDGKPEAFRQKYRNIDVLLVDDIQFLSKKEHTQEEFFHTFNTLHDADKQIIISSDRHPREIQTLEDRLRSRFEWGLITDIQAPDLETRIAILRKKALLENLTVPNDVMVYIASRIDNNIRELEGALTRVMAYASLNKQIITKDLAADALKNVFTNNETRTVTLELVQEIVSSYFKIDIAELVAKKRTRNLAFPRQIAMYLCRVLTDASLPRIGEIFGGRDHTTVLHAYDKISTGIKTDKKLDMTIKELTNRIKNL
ncbi:chromosomal replication initiator protein DnaA [Pectinatus brassicae]|uniref:Chromosomal replication initiator protein DnaA n=1 Tax=Pectinatus brassicae TaxID=862415 RepID=A0A840UVS4_9FIRM|nr:chromosomal replication initiator protein DnaA [Pectinatus brassicae]MBB5336934.1 chromosomal replication initiator protein [Pectinatus brassicae]